MMDSQKPWTFDRLMNVLIYFGGIALFLFLLYYLRDYLAPFLLALLVAYLLEPTVLFFKNKVRVRYRGLAILLTFIAIIIFIVLILAFVIPQVNNEVIRAKELIGEYVSGVDEKALIPVEYVEWIRQFLDSDNLSELVTKENITEYGSKLFSIFWNGISQVTGVISGLLVVISFFLYLIFIMIYYDYFSDNWEDIIPPQYRERVVMLIRDINREMSVYFRGQAQVVFWVAILFAVGFRIIGLPLGILLGFFVGLLNFVPYLQTVGLIPASLLGAMQAMESGNSFYLIFIEILVVFAVVQTIQEIILNPKILGDATGLNPAIILLSLSIWGGLFGVVGMIIALPMTSLMINYYRRFVLKKTS